MSVPQTAQTPSPVGPSRGTLWGIDKRIIIGALVFLILVVPVIPREKVVHVTGTTMVTQTLQSTSYVTLLQTYPTTTQKQIQVYVGWISQGCSSNYYCYWDPYYGLWICPYTGSQYGSKTTIDPTDHVIRVDYVNEAGGTLSITLYTQEGQQRVFRKVCGYDLTLSGTATVSETVSLTNTMVNTMVSPYTDIQSQPTDHDEIVIERVSILQLILGY